VGEKYLEVGLLRKRGKTYLDDGTVMLFNEDEEL
jgi:hypothetical protein